VVNQSNSRKSCASFCRVNTQVQALDPLLGPSDQRNVIRLADLFPHVAHHAKIYVRVHAELATHLTIGESTGEGSKYDCFFASQRLVQLECGSVLDADHFGSMLR
jgi:hypothetical protein